MLLDLSVITVNHNHRAVIEDCLNSLFSIPDRAGFEAVLIDNACADGTAEWARFHRPEVQIVRNSVRKGYAANANAGLRTAARGRYVLLLNPDVVCLPGLLDGLVVFMDQHPDVGLAAPQLLNPDGSVQPNCRRFPAPLALALRALRLDRALENHPALGRYLMSDWDHASAADVDWLTGALLIVRRAAIQQVGMMDERYFLYWEDLDWCCRMWQAGWRVCYVPQARAIHRHCREGVRRPFSRPGREQLLGAVKFFVKFGWNTAPHRPVAKT